MAWCLCDECEYRKECKYYRKVVACPYMVEEENNNINTKKIMAKDYWLIERKFKNGDQYFISDVKYSEKNSLLKEVADFIGSYKSGLFKGDILDFYISIDNHIKSIAKRNPRCRVPIISRFMFIDGSYSIVGYYGSEDVFSMYCSKVKGTIE